MALPTGDSFAIALPITGGSLKLFGVIAAIIALTCLASTLGTFFRRRIWHAE